MNNNPSIVPKRSLFRLAAYGVILILLIGCALPYLWKAHSRGAQDLQDSLQGFAILLGIGGLLLWILACLFPATFQRLFRREMLQRYFFGFACLATVIAGIYAFENWRGKRAWENCRKQLESKGAVLDWAAYIPPTVPDEQNIYKAPNMTEWFVKAPLDPDGTASTRRRVLVDLLQHKFYDSAKPDLSTVALVTVISSSDTRPVQADAVLQYTDSRLSYVSDGPGEPLFKEKLRKLLEQQMRTGGAGSKTMLFGAQNLNFVTDYPQISPLQIFVRANKAPLATEFQKTFSDYMGEPVRVRKIGTNSFKISREGVSADPTVLAADYLDWCDQHKEVFATIREALKRPYARMDGDYEHPFAQPIPDFLAVRVVAQILAQRAQCHLLLKQPEAALRDLEFMDGVRALLLAKPTGQPMTLVSAMINVAVVGLQQNVVADGFRLQAWKEPQMMALGQRSDNYIAPVLAATQAQQAALLESLLETTYHSDDLYYASKYGAQDVFSRKFLNPGWLLFHLAPRGWIYQNMVSTSLLFQDYVDRVAESNDLIAPKKWTAVQAAHERIHRDRNPFNFIARFAIPNMNRAIETAACNQTMANQSVVVAALERYRLAHRVYPETLDALVPQFLEAVPKDIVGGQSLKYRRTIEGRFLLYSLGWNEKDDGGVAKPSSNASEPDWVWDPKTP